MPTKVTTISRKGSLNWQKWTRVITITKQIPKQPMRGLRPNNNPRSMWKAVVMSNLKN